MVGAPAATRSLRQCVLTVWAVVVLCVVWLWLVRAQKADSPRRSRPRQENRASRAGELLVRVI